MPRYFSDVLSEIILICVYPLSGLVVNFIPKSRFESKKEGKTIVIIERWLTFNIRHLYWKYYLERKGFKVLIKNFPLRHGNFEESGEQLKQYMDKHRCKDVVLVGISGGAITSLLYLQEHNGWEKVDKFISVGSPFQGTWAALAVSFAYSGRELLPNSLLIKKIKKMEILHPQKIFCITAKYDEMVPRGAVLLGSHSVSLPVVGHNNLHLRIRGTYKKIAEFASH